jgi:hypothetical protein
MHNSSITCAAPAGAHGRGGDAAAGQPLIFGQQLGRAAHHGLADPAAGGMDTVADAHSLLGQCPEMEEHAQYEAKASFSMQTQAASTQQLTHDIQISTSSSWLQHSESTAPVDWQADALVPFLHCGPAARVVWHELDRTQRI